MITLLYEDDWLVAVDKPSGLLVHRSPLDRHATEFALQYTRDALGGQHVYPIHRLDRPTSGVLLLAKDPQTARVVGQAFAERTVTKTYVAIVRGWIEAAGRLDYPLQEELDKHTEAQLTPKVQEAITRYWPLAKAEIPLSANGRHPTSRYSLVALQPETGRKHQLRRHLAHLRHPIVGDTRHGDGKQNNLFRQQWDNQRLLLAAYRLNLTHPHTGQPLAITAPLGEDMWRIMQALGWDESVVNF